MARPRVPDSDKKTKEIRLLLTGEQKAFYEEARKRLCPDADLATFARLMLRDGVQYQDKMRSGRFRVIDGKDLESSARVAGEL